MTLLHSYGGEGPSIMGITWTEAFVVTILIVLRICLKLTGKENYEPGQALYWVLWAWVGSP